MAKLEVNFVEGPIVRDPQFEAEQKRIVDLIQEARAAAIAEGIEANSIIFNKNMVKVQSFGMGLPDGGSIILPDMICGLNAYWTDNELPQNYSFAIVEGPHKVSDRLAQFEAIGMEPAELQKAAELYRKIKEEMEC